MAELVSQTNTNRVSLVRMIELGVQQTYHDLTVLAELLPRKTDFERKVEIVNFAERTRLLFIRLLALVKWASGASKIEQCMDIVSFLEKQALLFTNTADNMCNISRNTLAQARLPSFQLPCAVEVLTLGTYSRMPTIVRDKIVPPDPISIEDKKATLDRLNYIIEQRLSTSVIHPSMRNLKVEYGRVIFHVDNEFDLKLTVFSDSPNCPWTVLSLDLLAEDADAGEGKDLVQPSHVNILQSAIQKKMMDSQHPLYEVFVILHSFCLSLQIEVLHEQIERLLRERLASFIKITEHVPGQRLAITYWRNKNFLEIQTDQNDSSKPLKLRHQPELSFDGIKGHSFETDNSYSFKPGNVSIEYLITDTIHKRTLIKLTQLANELKEKKYGQCVVSGVPTLLHVSCLEPCAASEELIISIDLNGSYLAHVPQYEKSCPLADNIQESLNSNRSKLGTYFDQLKIWLTKKRCIKTIGYLSVTATESLPLCSKANHAKLDDRVPRLFFQFNKYNQYYLMAEFFTSDSHPFSVKTRYSLLVTESASYFPGDGLDIDSDNMGESVQRDLIVVENILVLDISAIIAASFHYEAVTFDKMSAKLRNYQSFVKREPLKEKNMNSLATNSSNIKNVTLPSNGFGPFVLKTSTQPTYLVNELPQIVGFCEERLAHLALEKELRNRNIKYEVSRSNASGSIYCITLLKIPQSNFKALGCYTNALQKDTFVMNLCLQEKTSKMWQCQYLFKNCPISPQSSKEQSSKRFVFSPYENSLLTSKSAAKYIDETLMDWTCMTYLYDVVKEFARDIEQDQTILEKITIRSFNYKKFVMNYGPRRNLSVTIVWRPNDRKFQLTFSVVGGEPFSSNPHSFMAIHYKQEFNQHRSIKTLVKNLSMTLEPMAILHNFPTFPILGGISGIPLVPVASFCLIPLSSRSVRLVYRNFYCFSIKIQSNDSLVVRDGSYSRFDRTRNVEELYNIPALDVLLGKTTKSPFYTLSMREFEQVFRVALLEQHLGMAFTMKQIQRRSEKDGDIVYINSEFMQYRFSIEPIRKLVQMKALPNVNDNGGFNAEEIDILEKYFVLKVASYPHKADNFLSFSRLLTKYPKSVLKDFIQIFKMELYPERLDANIHWNISLCTLIPPGMPPYFNAGMSSICPLKNVMVFFIQLTFRNVYALQMQHQQPSFQHQLQQQPSVYIALSYDLSNNNLMAYLPQRGFDSNALSYLVGIDGVLRRYCQTFRTSGFANSCIIYPALRDLMSHQNLLSLGS